MSYHINPKTGNAGLCKAKKQCPFGGKEDHYPSREAAQEAYELLMETKLKTATTASILSQVELKEMDAALLATTLFKEAQARGLDANYIASSMDVAAILHAHQSRAVRAGYPRTPYIEHPLRNAVRLMRMGVKNENLIVAAVLHDTVEDSADVFVKKYLKLEPSDEHANREKLRSFIKHQYGAETLSVVDAVTNPVATDEDKKLSRKEKQENYRAHVIETLKTSPGGYLVKFSDFIDNAGSLSHQDLPGNERMVFNLASKYQPLIKEFQAYAPTVSSLIDAKGRRKIEVDLATLDRKLTEIIAKYGP